MEYDRKAMCIAANFKINIGQTSVIIKIQENKTKKVFCLQGYAMDVKSNSFTTGSPEVAKNDYLQKELWKRGAKQDEKYRIIRLHATELSIKIFLNSQQPKCTLIQNIFSNVNYCKITNSSGH